MNDASAGHDRAVQSAEFELGGSPFRIRANVHVTPGGLLAIGGLVSSILIATSVLVWTSTGVPRRHPLAARLGRG